MTDLPALLAPISAATCLLASASIAKARRPAPTGLALGRLGLASSDLTVRALALLEALVVCITLLTPRFGMVSLAVTYSAFAIFSALSLRRGPAACGCFGDETAQMGYEHVVLNLTIAALCAAAAWTTTDAQLRALVDSPAQGLVAIALGAIGAIGLRSMLSDLPNLRSFRAAT